MKDLICQECGKNFRSDKRNQYGYKKYCSNECSRIAYNAYRRKKITKTSSTKPPQYRGGNNNKSREFHSLEAENRFITKLLSLSEKIQLNMKISKLKQYPKKTQTFCIEIIQETYNFLENQLNNNKKNGRVIIDVN